jgi:hypothetical protein
VPLAVVVVVVVIVLVVVVVVAVATTCPGENKNAFRLLGAGFWCPMC